MIRKWPMTTFCILVNEFCERFSFYGMRTVLTLYLVNVLRFGDAYSTTFFHAFSALCFFSPIFGSILADGKKPTTSNVFADVWRLCTRALGQKFRSSEPKAHWLDHACEQSTACQSLKRRRCDQSACAEARFVEDVKSLFRVLIMYLPLPMFWALYDQQGSGVVYPIARKVVTLTPLRKMVVGGLLASVAFVICGLTQTEVNKTLAIIPPAGRAYVSLMNTLPDCSINATVGDRTAFIPPEASLENTHNDRQLFDVPKGSVEFSFAFSGIECFADVLPTCATFNVTRGQIFFVHVSQHGIVTIATDKNYDGNFAFCREKKATDQQPCNPKEPADFYLFARNYTDGGQAASDLIGDFAYVTKRNDSTHVAAVFDAKPIRPGTWRLYYVGGTPRTVAETNATFTGIRIERLEQGGVYMLSLTGSFEAPTRHEFRVVPDNGLSILWQIPQIVVITTAEVLFAIPGLEFSYTQAAPSMKSIVGGFYLVTMGVGDTCIVIFTILFRNMNPATVCFIYAALMLAVIVIFGFMAVFYYQYADIDEKGDELVDCSSSDGNETSVDVKRSSLLNGDLLADNKGGEWDSRL
ncbi:Peptide transporter family 1 [Aphelenchoides fujianensis]|nr:Peptide transporter family 1 [Aphelenchoides fujianensis]